MENGALSILQEATADTRILIQDGEDALKFSWHVLCRKNEGLPRLRTVEVADQ